MDDLTLWALIRELGSAIASGYRPVIEKVLEKSGLDGRELSLLLAVWTFEPDNTTPAHLLVRNPYASAELYFARLSSTARLGYLGEVAPGEFRLTPDGRQLVDRFIADARQAMIRADPLAITDSRRLAEVLGKLVTSSLETPPPPNPWSIGLSHKLMPEHEPPLPFSEQAISCLAGYRDDAHLAAWRKTGLSAIGLEILTLIWRGQAGSLRQLVDRLSHRGYPPEVYVDGVDELKKDDYIQGPDNDLTLTDEGRIFRDTVEADTNRYFFAPWSCLSEEERTWLQDLSNLLIAGLKDNPSEADG
jgi:hypothetical protein